MSESSNALACLECGLPIPHGERWVHSPQCAAVMALVRYGRLHREKDLDPDDPDVLDMDADPDRLNKYREQAGIVGLFPSLAVRRAVLHRDRGHCQYPGCTEPGAVRIDWKEEDPSLRSVRARDLRTLCDVHHRGESLQRFVGEGGQVARTGPAMWARIVSAEPLVLRDDESLWKDPKNRAALSHWPLAPEQTRRDLDDWVAALAEASPDIDGAVDDAAQDWLTAAFEKLGLPLRRRERLVRAIHAAMLKAQADEATLEALRQELAPWRDGQPAPKAGRMDRGPHE